MSAYYFEIGRAKHFPADTETTKCVRDTSIEIVVSEGP